MSRDILRGKAPFILLVFPAIFAGAGFWLWKVYFDVADEVWDAGDYLVIRNTDQEDRILLADVMSVSCSLFTNPPQVALILRQPCRFGKMVCFIQQHRPIPYLNRVTPLALELIERVEAARKGI